MFSCVPVREQRDAPRSIAVIDRDASAIRACNRSRMSQPHRFALVVASNVPSTGATTARPRPARREKTVSFQSFRMMRIFTTRPHLTPLLQGEEAAWRQVRVSSFFVSRSCRMAKQPLKGLLQYG